VEVARGSIGSAWRTEPRGARGRVVFNHVGHRVPRALGRRHAWLGRLVGPMGLGDGPITLGDE
jgi:hypothetical protein